MCVSVTHPCLEGKMELGCVPTKSSAQMAHKVEWTSAPYAAWQSWEIAECYTGMWTRLHQHLLLKLIAKARPTGNEFKQESLAGVQVKVSTDSCIYESTSKRFWKVELK